MKTRDLVLTAIFAAICVVCAQLVIPTAPIPFSLAVFSVLLSSAVLDKKYAVYCQLVYLLLGIVGLPVFAKFSSGIGALVGPTGGYLVSYPVMAFLTAYISEKIRSKKPFGNKIFDILSYLPGMVVAVIACHLMGTAWLAISTKNTFLGAAAIASFPFLGFDALKMILAAAAASTINALLNKNVKA